MIDLARAQSVTYLVGATVLDRSAWIGSEGLPWISPLGRKRRKRDILCPSEEGAEGSCRLPCWIILLLFLSSCQTLAGLCSSGSESWVPKRVANGERGARRIHPAQRRARWVLLPKVTPKHRARWPSRLFSRGAGFISRSQNHSWSCLHQISCFPTESLCWGYQRWARQAGEAVCAATGLERVFSAFRSHFQTWGARWGEHVVRIVPRRARSWNLGCWRENSPFSWFQPGSFPWPDQTQLLVKSNTLRLLASDECVKLPRV